MKRLVRAIAFIACFLPIAASSAQEGELRVTLADTIRTAASGTALSYLFTIESSDPQEGNAELMLPHGWKRLSGSGTLPEGSKRILYMVSAGIPATAAPGRYRLELKVRRGGQTAVAGAWVIVPLRQQLLLSLIDVPDVVVAGMAVRARFNLTNRGNAPALVRIGIKSRELSFMDSMFVNIAPGASEPIPIVLKTNPAIPSLLRATTTVTATTVGSGGVVSTSAFRVSIAPEQAHAAAPVHTITSHVRLIGASTPEGGTGLEIRGSGPLRDGSDVNVEYVGRRMNERRSLFGDRDEYRVAVYSPSFRIFLGDQVNRLSPLSENGRYARGALVELTSTGWTVGGFLNRSVGLLQKPEQRAMFVRRDLGNGVLLAVNFLDRIETGGGKMLTAHTIAKSLPIGSLEGEVGHAIDAPAARAWMLRALGTFRRFSYTLHRQKADRQYPGAARGMEQANATIDASPVRGARLHASAREYLYARSRIALDSSMSRHWNQNAGIMLGGRLSLDYIRNGRRDTSFPGGPAREEHLGAVGVTLKSGPTRLNASAAFGDGVSGSSQRQALARYSAAVSTRPHERLSLSMNAELLKGGTLFNPQQESERRGGIAATIETRGGSRFSVSGYAAEHFGGRTIRDAGVDASLDQELRNGHRLSLRVRFNRNPSFESPGDNVLRAEYTVPFALPVARSRSRGRVTGRVYDVESRAGIPGAVVQLGDQVAMTDRKGRFAFSAASTAPAMLSVSGSQATAGSVSVADLPLRVEAVMGQTLTFDIAMASAGSVQGRARLFVTPPGFRDGETLPAVEDSLGLPGARLELVRNGEVRRTVSTARGEFLFTDLRPGEWHLRIATADVPRFHYLQGDSVVVNVRAGGRASAELLVLPRKRKITIVDGR